MHVTCFACDARIDGPDLAAIAEAFLAHGREAHDWTFPEAALRNYACNYAEASERVSDDVERRDTIDPIAIRPVTPANLADWQRFFDRDAFAGNPSWASCYCLEPHAPAPPEEPERPWRTTRGMMLERLANGGAFGYLAYVDGRPAGWVNASLRADYELFRDVDPAGPEGSTVIGVSCFVVAPPYRRHGVAAALLDRVIADAPARGAAWIEAYPHLTPEDTDGGHFRGPRGMFEARGFERVADAERYAVLRRPVG
jgi:GNAT superfamily N-acetyltransferase